MSVTIVSYSIFLHFELFSWIEACFRYCLFSFERDLIVFSEVFTILKANANILGTITVAYWEIKSVALIKTNLRRRYASCGSDDGRGLVPRGEGRDGASLKFPPLSAPLLLTYRQFKNRKQGVVNKWLSDTALKHKCKLCLKLCQWKLSFQQVPACFIAPPCGIL